MEIKTPQLPRVQIHACGIQLECFVGDITEQAGFQAVVNAANAQLQPGSGVAGAIHRAAGPGLEAECKALAPIRPGEAVLTGGHGLPNRHVIHCLGPVYGVDEPSAELLADCYRNVLRLADSNGIESLAVPAISTGAFGYPFVEASEVACRTIMEILPTLTRLKRIRMVYISMVSANIACTLLTQCIRE